MLVAAVNKEHYGKCNALFCNTSFNVTLQSGTV